MTYLEERLSELGINNEFTIEVPHLNREETYSLLESDNDDNIVINYFTLYGTRQDWKKQGTKFSRQFVRKRLKYPAGDGKYFQEKGSGQFIYFPPELIRKFIAKETIETLFVTEGEFKALKGAIEGINVVGIPSIHGFYEGDIKGRINDDLLKFIRESIIKGVL